MCSTRRSLPLPNAYPTLFVQTARPLNAYVVLSSNAEAYRFFDPHLSALCRGQLSMAPCALLHALCSSMLNKSNGTGLCTWS
jgi:hypothetical protein